MLQATRKRRGAWYTPSDLVDLMVDRVLADLDTDPAPTTARTLQVLDPACGDGRLLAELGRRLRARGCLVDATGCDIDAEAVAAIDDPSIRIVHADALTHDWGDRRFDIVIGNPPFLSQMAVATTRGGSSAHGGGPYADAAAEFLALAVRLARSDGGRVALVLPQSILASRDAGPVRATVDGLADLAWSWWAPGQQHFDASVNVCVIGLRRPSTGTSPAWTSIVNDRLGVPSLDQLSVDGTLGDRAELNANFRDEYYALVPAVHDDPAGASTDPPLVTSGLIDPGRCHWGERPVRFAKRRFQRPRVDTARLTGRFPAWADRKLVPKVLVASQTRVVEAVADVDGAWLPGVPVTAIVPRDRSPDVLRGVEAVLTSPVAAAACWHQGAGTGLSTTSIRLGPCVLAAVPWPSGDVAAAVDALGRGDVLGCGRAIVTAYGIADGDALVNWWAERLPGRVGTPS